MKTFLILAVALAFVANAFALEKTSGTKKSAKAAKPTLKAVKSTKKPVAPAKTSAIAAKPILVASAAPTGSTGSSVGGQSLIVPGSPQSTISTPVKQVIKAQEKSPVSISYVTQNSLALKTVKNSFSASTDDREIQAWDSLVFNYQNTPNTSITFIPRLYHTWFGTPSRAQDSSLIGLSQPYSAYLDDAPIYLTRSKFAQFGNGMVMDAQLRYFLPLSEITQKSGSAGNANVLLSVGKEIGNFSFKVTGRARYYFNQYETSTLLAADGDQAGLPLQNKEYALYYYADIGYNFTKKLSFNLEAGLIESRFLADGTPRQYADGHVAPRDEIRKENVLFNPELSYTFNDHFALAIGLYEDGYNLAKQSSSTSTAYQPLTDMSGNQVYMTATFNL